MSIASTSGTRPINRLVGGVFGALYLVVGLLGFTVSGGHGFASMDGGKLLGVFMVNPLHNIVHLLVGGLLLAGARGGVKAAKGMNSLVGGVYLLVGIVGLFILSSSANILALNSADNGLHFFSAVVLLAVGLFADRAISARRSATAAPVA